MQVIITLFALIFPTVKLDTRPKTMGIHGKKWGKLIFGLPESFAISIGYTHRKPLVGESKVEPI